MTKTEFTEIASEIAEELNDPGMIDNPRGSAYYTIRECRIDDDTTLNLIVNVCKYKDESTGKKYYGIYNVVEADCGDNICESDWEYTKDCKKSSLIKTLQKIHDTWTDKVFIDTYNKTA